MTGSPDLQHNPTDGRVEASSRRLAYRGVAWAFAVILVLSVALLVFSWVAVVATTGRQPMLAEPGPASSLVLIISTATSIVSLIGLLSTNLLAWRREAREARSTEIQLQRQQLEIEKLRLELEKQKREE
jgi:uncharacterized membrane protein